MGQPARALEEYEQLCPAKPILKWAGGKQQMLNALIDRLPSAFSRYVEPMVGGGALFFGLAAPRALIADSNPELINLYRTVVADLDGIEAAIAEWPIEEVTFYKVRSLRFEDLEPTVAAARLIYLNRTCFNGLYRVNKEGQFNVLGVDMSGQRFLIARGSKLRESAFAALKFGLATMVRYFAKRLVLEMSYF